MTVDIEESDLADITPLSSDEERDLEKLESTIAANLAALFRVGFALYEIKRRRLYRSGFKTFEEYSLRRWELNRSHAYRMVSAAEICKNLSPIGDIPLPENECQIRPLAGLAPKVAVKVWKRACERAGDMKVTGALVQKVVAEVTKKASDGETVFRENWQLLIEPLLQKALIHTRHGDHDALDEVIERISLLLLVGKTRATPDATSPRDVD
jgi:hypothetical protein